MKLTKEQQDLAIDMASEGKPLKEIHIALCLTPKLFWQAREHDPSFQNRFERARQEGLENIADDLLTVADDYKDVHRARLKSDNAKWLLSKRKPQVYGDRIDVNVNQTVDIGGALAEARKRAELPARDVTPQIVEGESDESE